MGKGGVGTFQDLLDSIWEELFAYQTVKIVRTRDWRLSVMKKIFNAGVLVYVTFFVVFFHGYMMKELPSISVVGQVNEPTYRSMEIPAYCNKTYYPHLTASMGDQVRAECLWHFLPVELTSRESDGVWFYTMWEQIIYNRTCGDPTARSYPDDPRHFAECNEGEIIEKGRVYPVDIEFLELSLESAFTTSLGVDGANVKTYIYPRGEPNHPKRLIFFAGEEVRFSIATVLDMIGVHLDDLNEVYFEGEFGQRELVGIPYRMSGLEVQFLLQFQNHRDFSWPPDPFDFETHCNIEVIIQSRGAMRNGAPQVHYLGSNTNSLQQPDERLMTRYPRGVKVAFRSTGIIGKFETSMLFLSFFQAIVLFGVATTFVDIMAAFMIAGFKEQKFEDDTELRIRSILRSQLGNTTKRVEIDEFEREERRRQRESALIVLAANKKKGLSGVPGFDRHALGGLDGGDGQDQQQADQELLDAIEAQGGRVLVDPEDPTKVPQWQPAFDVLHDSRDGPRITRLEILGAPVTAKALTAQGNISGCHMVRFQWFTADRGGPFVHVPGGTKPGFNVTVEHVGRMLGVQAIPIGFDGKIGPARQAVVGPVQLNPATHRLATQAIVYGSARYKCQVHVASAEDEGTAAGTGTGGGAKGGGAKDGGAGGGRGGGGGEDAAGSGGGIEATLVVSHDAGVAVVDEAGVIALSMPPDTLQVTLHTRDRCLITISTREPQPNSDDEADGEEEEQEQKEERKAVTVVVGSPSVRDQLALVIKSFAGEDIDEMLQAHHVTMDAGTRV